VLRSFILSLVCAALCWTLSNAALAAALADESRLVRKHRGITLIALPPRLDTPDDVKYIDGAAAHKRLAASYDLLVRRSPKIRRAIERLKSDGLVLLYYLPWDLEAGADGRDTTEAVALFFPHLPDSYGLSTGKRRYLVAVGRLGINWPTDELATVLAHELAGHGMQLLEGRMTTTRQLDRECEALLVHEQANQDLGLDKSSRDMIEFRQAMERHYCRDFTAYLKEAHPAAVSLWDKRNPKMPRLQSLFRQYLAELRRNGVTGDALATSKNQLKEDLSAVYTKGKPHQIFQIGRNLWDGFGIQADRAEAIRWFVRAATLGHIEARKAIVAAAKTDHPAAQSNLGVLYEKEGDLAQAVSWYRMAADKGDSHAQSNLGNLYRTGQGVARDFAKAAQLFNRAAGKGNSVAMSHLGAMVENGQGSARDPHKAAEWYRRAAKQGNSWAQYRLARLYYLGRLGKKDLPKAVSLYRKSADSGYGAAQNMLGWLYMHGKGLEKDYVKARILLKHAAAQGNRRAFYNLGTIYRRGLGVSKDFSWARRWFRRGADKGYAPAMFRLGWIHAIGQGVKPNAAEAAKWFHASAKLGYASSLARLGKIYADGNGVAKDPVQAYAWYRVAEIRKARGVKKARAALASQLSPEQRAAGEKKALAWKPSQFKGP
jgi:TPR repeat protein